MLLRCAAVQPARRRGVVGRQQSRAAGLVAQAALGRPGDGASARARRSVLDAIDASCLRQRRFPLRGADGSVGARWRHKEPSRSLGANPREVPEVSRLPRQRQPSRDDGDAARVHATNEQKLMPSVRSMTHHSGRRLSPREPTLIAIHPRTSGLFDFDHRPLELLLRHSHATIAIMGCTRRWRFIQGVAQGALLGVLTLSGVSTAGAQSIPGTNCPGSFYYASVQATQATQVGNHAGVSSDLWVGEYSNDCSRVSSLAVQVPGTGGIIEWGWVLGYLWARDVNGWCADTYYHSVPTRFAVWRPINGSKHCSREGGIGQEVFRTFALKDGDSNAIWKYTYEGSLIGSVSLNFDRGRLLTNSERHREADSAYADFDRLRFQIAGNSTFFDFSQLREVEDSDPPPGFSPNYNCVRINDRHIQVRTQPDSCPDL